MKTRILSLLAAFAATCALAQPPTNINVGRFGAGSVSVPSLAFQASTGTGFFYDGSNGLKLSTAGTLALTINSSQNWTVPGGMLLGGATGGMPSAGVINAVGLKINGVDVSTSSDTYWVADAPGIKYTAGPVSLVGTPTGDAGDLQVEDLTATTGTFAGAVSGITTLGASGVVSLTNTTAATSSTTGSLIVGNGTAATTVGIGGGNIYAGGLANIAGNLTVSGTGPSLFAAGSNGTQIGRLTSDTFMSAVSLNGSFATSASILGFYGRGDGGDLNLYHNVPTGGEHRFTVNGGSSRITISNTAVTLAGNLTVSGDVLFSAAGSGLPYGATFGKDIAWSQSAAVQNTWYLVTDTDMTEGPLNLMTGDGSGKLTATDAGTYKIDMALSLQCSGTNNHVEYGVSIDGAAPVMYLREFFPSVAQEQHGSISRIITLTAGQTIELAVRTPDTGTPDITVDCLSVAVVKVGG